MDNYHPTLRIRELDLNILPPTVEDLLHPDKSKGGMKLTVIGKPGCFAAGTPVLRMNGTTKPVENFVSGDQVMGDDGTPRTILAVTSGEEDMVHIQPHSGPGYTVNMRHKLVLWDPETQDTHEIRVSDYLAHPLPWRTRQRVLKRGVLQYQPSATHPYSASQLYNRGRRRAHKLQKGRCRCPPSSWPSYVLRGDLATRTSYLAGWIHIAGSYDPYLDLVTVQHLHPMVQEQVAMVCRSIGLQAFESEDALEISGPLERLVHAHSTHPRLSQITSDELELREPFTITQLGPGTYHGFTVDGNHRFLLGSYDVVRNTGKSWLISSLLYAKRNLIPVSLVFSGTEDSNHHYQQIIPSTFVYNRLDMDVLQQFVSRQKIARKYVDNPWALLILDDCTDDPRIFKTPLMQGMYKNGRHWNMLYILSLQYCMDVLPVIRTNTDGVFIMREPNVHIRRRIYENYAGIIPDFSIFCDLMDQIANNYTALYIHNADTSNRMEDCVFWYKAPKVPDDFRFGCEDFWKFHDQRFNEDYKESYF